MKKKLFLFGLFVFFCSVSYANNFKDNKINLVAFCNESKNEIQEKFEKNSIDKENCNKENQKERDEFKIDDDEYFTYNQCFFDKKYRKMKNLLCLTRRQEACIDEIYSNFKADMESLFFRHKESKEAFLKAYECKECDLKEHKKLLNEIKKEAREKCKDFKQEIEEHLCKNQKKCFKKFQRKEKRSLKRIAKYSKVYKFPCVNCCSK